MEEERGPIECRVRVPATTTNFGPGFDAFGAALRLYNWTTLRVGNGGSAESLPPMVQEAAEAFGKAVGEPIPSFECAISGEVPCARGLGSSATVRVGVLVGLNELRGRPLSRGRLVALASALEGHPDNVAAAVLGGFTISTDDGQTRVALGSQLEFVAFIPDMEMETEWARSVVAQTVSLQDAVWNLQRASRIAAAICLRRYEELSGLFEDRWHEPARVKRIAAWEEMRRTAYGAGAIGFYLSGAGSTLMALAVGRGGEVATALTRVAAKRGLKGICRRIQAENRGAKAWLRRPSRRLA
ncbi:homoserine kinase [Methylacidimicrobium sp. B4]|uniref:homoserine kinase n=1 Tax=Methylacidimicrobium sp. B4 TaxID=2796139 RepID=UPI001A8D183B|nr:homoserine kinase [Methylacidimicrobium sp. B4]QSR84032.1 homoserine kinase [Methylacidimicrobium sp. B4]